MNNIRYYYCPSCYSRFDSRKSDGDLSDCCKIPLDNMYPESYYDGEDED